MSELFVIKDTGKGQIYDLDPNKVVPLFNRSGDSYQSNSNVIDMSEGEYLMDIINEINQRQEIEKPTAEKPLTINFYNHSKTIDWSRFTEKIHFPRHVYLNFVGEINWWPYVYNQAMSVSEGLLSRNPMDKLFLGFSFNRENTEDLILATGLPNNLNTVYFGGLDDNYIEYESYSDVNIYEINQRGIFRVNGTKDDDNRNDALYIRIGDNGIDVTPDFKSSRLSNKDLSYSYFYFANCEGANFDSTNCQVAEITQANCQGANFEYANCEKANFSSSNCQSTIFKSANCKSMSLFRANCEGASFKSANCQGTNFYLTNLRGVNWDNVISIAGANFQNADLTGGLSLPTRINTKAKFIAECGANKVNSQTIWIDGTSILS